MVVGYIGRPQFDGDLQTIETLTAKKRPLEFRRVTSLSELDGIHLLFVGRSERRRLGSILEACQRYAILTFGEMNGFVEAGGMVNFVTVKEKGRDRLRFELNRERAEREGFRFASYLLKLSIVNPPNP